MWTAFAIAVHAIDAIDAVAAALDSGEPVQTVAAVGEQPLAIAVKPIEIDGVGSLTNPVVAP